MKFIVAFKHKSNELPSNISSLFTEVKKCLADNPQKDTSYFYVTCGFESLVFLTKTYADFVTTGSVNGDYSHTKIDPDTNEVIAGVKIRKDTHIVFIDYDNYLIQQEQKLDSSDDVKEDEDLLLSSSTDNSTNETTKQMIDDENEVIKRARETLGDALHGQLSNYQKWCFFFLGGICTLLLITLFKLIF